MKLFGQLVRTVVNVALLPVAVTKDFLTLGGTIDDNGGSHTAQQVRQLKKEAGDEG